MGKRNYTRAVLTAIIALSLVVAGAYAYRQLAIDEKIQSTKKGEELIGGQKDVHGCLVAAGYSWCEAKQVCLRAWEEACLIEPTESDIDSIRQAFMKKYSKNADEIQITINEFDGRFARGGVKLAMNSEFGEGGIFLAYKEGQVWKLVFDGNGMISCSVLDKYNFPEEMSQYCYEEEAGLVSDSDNQKKVEDYIKENISELSPEDAVLGGKFFVTEIKFIEDNKVIVEYEDGHIAFRAEAQIKLSPDDVVEIDKFTIVKDYQK